MKECALISAYQVRIIEPLRAKLAYTDARCLLVGWFSCGTLAFKGLSCSCCLYTCISKFLEFLSLLIHSV